MKIAVIDKNKCDHSPLCPVKRICPAGAVTQKVKFLIRGEAPEIDASKCTGCGKCTKICPHGAVKLKVV